VAPEFDGVGLRHVLTIRDQPKVELSVLPLLVPAVCHPENSIQVRQRRNKLQLDFIILSDGGLDRRLEINSLMMKKKETTKNNKLTLGELRTYNAAPEGKLNV
jgi:hypothetical protein